MDDDAMVAMDEARGRWVLAAAVLGSAVSMVTGTVVNVALPTIQRDLGADTAGIQWVVNAYLITLSALLLLGGSAGDRFGRRRVFELGLVGFALASLACAVAPTLPLLVVARLLQGVAAAAVTPASLAILQAVFVPGDRARAIGAWSGLGGIAAAVGPLVGGLLVDAVGWRSVFLLPVPLALLAWAVARRHVPENRDLTTADADLDVGGGLIAAVALGGLSYALLEAPGRGPGTTVVVALVVGLAALAAFLPFEHRREDPMLPPGIFASGQFRAANAVTFVVYAALGGVFFLLVIHLQTVLGWSAVAAGAATLPITGLMLLLSSRSGALAQRIGPRIPLTVGPVVLAAGMVGMSTIGAGDEYVTGVLPWVVVFGLGLAALVAPVTAAALAAAEGEHTGVASAINNTVSRVAQLVAVAALPVLAGITGDAAADPAAFGDGFSRAMSITAGVSLAGGALAWLTIDPAVLDEDDDALERATVGRRYALHATDRAHVRHCAVDGAPVHVGWRDPDERRGVEHGG